MEELHNLMSGDKNLYSVLDEKLTATIKLANVVYEEGNKYFLRTFLCYYNFYLFY